MKCNKFKKIIFMLLCLFSMAVLMCMPAFATSNASRVMNAEDGMVSDDGEHMPLSPEAGTVEGTGDGIIGDASSALGDVSEAVSDAASDILGITGDGDSASSGSASTSASTSAATGTGTAGASGTSDGGNIAAAVIICIIIAIAIIVLVIVLIPKKKD